MNNIIENRKKVYQNLPKNHLSLNDLVLLYDAPSLSIVQEFASDNTVFQRDFKSAWTKLMNIDRFDGPVFNVCDIKKKK